MRFADEKNPSTVLAAAALAAGVVGGGIYVYERRHRRSRNTPWQSLKGWCPLVGHAHLAFPITEIVSKWESWAKEYAGETGCYEMDLFGRRFLIISSEERAMEIFQHRPYVAVRPSQLSDALSSIGSAALFGAEGDEWKKEHKLLVPALNKANVNDYLSVFKDMAHRLVRKWSASASAQVSVNIGPDLTNLAADSISIASMDKDFDFLDSESQASNDIKSVMSGFVNRSLMPFPYWKIPIIGQYLDGLGWSINRTTALVNDVVAQYEEQGGNESKRTFLQKVYTLMQSKNESIPRHRLVGNVLGLFLAGTDTTSKALLTALYLLAEDPTLQKELRQEADSVDLDAMLLQDFYTKIPRIKSFLHEVHRWYGVPGHSLFTTKDLPFCGTILPKGTDVVVLSRPVSWQSKDVPRGPNDSPPSNFDPARYLVTAADGSLTSVFPNTKLGGFLSFGYGARACPGRTYSEALSYAVIVAVLQAFTWCLTPDHPKPRFIFDIIMSPDCDINLVLMKRDVVVV